MSPAIKAQRVSIGNIATMLTAITVCAGLLMGAVRFVRVTFLDVRYAQRDSLHAEADSLKAYQQGEARKEAIVAVQHDYEIRDIHALIARVDSNSRCARKHKPAWCAE